jgi:hypothetical protein
MYSMAMTHDYMDYLEDQIGISPANSQEELQAAQTIADLMRQHDVDVNVEEFDAPGLGRMVRCVLLALTFVGAILSGTGVSALGVILTVVPAVLLMLDVLGIGGGFLSKLGPSARSQNVVAVHHATGELVAKGNRPIVVVAHYDSPHDSFLYGSPLSHYIPTLRKALKWFVPAVGLCSLLQAFTFLPAAFRSLLWVAGILLAIPLAAFGADGIYQKFSRCSLGSNDNKSSVAALLGTLDNVRPSDEKPVSQRAIERKRREQEAAKAAELAASQIEADSEPTHVSEPQPEEVVGVRHDKDVIAALGILPADCEIEYVDSSRSMRASSFDADQTSELPGSPVRAGARIDAETQVGAADSTESLPKPVSSPAKDASVDSAPAAPVPNGDATGEAPVPTNAPTADAEATDAPAPAPEKTHFFDRKKLASMFDRFESRGVGEKDDSGLTATPSDDLGSTRPSAPTPRKRPEKPDDPNWGKSNFKPQVSDVARRAALFDLPDPSRTSDPLSSDPDATQLAPSHPAATPRRRSMGNLLSDADAQNAQRIRSDVADSDVPVITPAPAAPEPTQEPIEAQQDGLDVISADDLGVQQEPELERQPEKHHFSLFGHNKDNGAGHSRNQAMRGSNWLSDDPENWDDSSDSDPWKGGATTRSGLRLVEDVPAQAADDSLDAAPADEAPLEDVPSDVALDSFADVDGASDEEAAETPTDAPTEEDLRAAVLHMGDDELVCHDIWFVALGASDLDHAGMRSFLTEHRTAIRGAFLVNLDCVGAGDLSLLTHEGFEPTRRADRRLLRLLAGTAADLHVDLKTQTYDWADTDASVAMRSSVRAVTVMGIGENGLPALSRTEQDVPENVDGDQAASVAELVTEMIRRS